MQVRELMQTEVVSIAAEEPMSVGLKRLRDRRIKHLPVVDGRGRPVGIVTDRDLKRASASDATALEVHELLYLLERVRMADIMTGDPVTTAPDAPVADAARLMVERNVGCLPVVEGERMVGIVTTTDLLRYVAGQGA